MASGCCSSRDLTWLLVLSPKYGKLSPLPLDLSLFLQRPWSPAYSFHPTDQEPVGEQNLTIRTAPTKKGRTFGEFWEFSIVWVNSHHLRVSISLASPLCYLVISGQAELRHVRFEKYSIERAMWYRWVDRGVGPTSLCREMESDLGGSGWPVGWEVSLLRDCGDTARSRRRRWVTWNCREIPGDLDIVR